MSDAEPTPPAADLLGAAQGHPPLEGLSPPGGETITASLGPPSIAYPQSYATAATIDAELIALADAACASFYLDTIEQMGHTSFGFGLVTKGEDHTQGLARTQLLSDGSIYWFLSYSDIGGAGSLSQYGYSGGLDSDHVVQTSPLTVAPMNQLLVLDGEPHPSDITFLPDVGGADAGYVFVTEEYDQHLVAIYAWAPGRDFELVGRVGLGGAATAAGPPAVPFPSGGPNLLFIDLVGDEYLLGIASDNWGLGYLYTAAPAALFPSAAPGQLDVSAFTPVAGTFSFPLVGSPCQCKLVRDSTGAWSLLGFRSDPYDSENGTDYVDVYPVSYPPLVIGDRTAAVHVDFAPGDTSFASTGTHYVEASGRLLVSSSYRWAEDEGPGSSGYVTRVDELPSWSPAPPRTVGGGGGGIGTPVGPDNPPRQLE
jgi:hypothetical protein